MLVVEEFIMLEVHKRKKARIQKVERIEDHLILYSERGNLRIQPQNELIVRITYTEREKFLNNKGLGIIYESVWGEWDYSEYDNYIEVFTSKIKLRVYKEEGNIEYFNEDNKRVLMEREHECREVEEFPSYRRIIDQNTEIEEIETPDGIKKRIVNAKKIFDKDLYSTKLHIKWQPDEKLYGLGQSEDGLLNLRGRTVYLHQANLKIAIPFLVSTNGYGILLATSSTSIFEDTQVGSYLYTEADEEMDYYVIIGNNMDKIISGYRFLTGKASLLPRWAYGFLQSQERFEDEKEILDIADSFREQKIGIDGLILDWCSWEDGMWGQKTFDAHRFPNPQDMIDKLHKNNIRFMLSIWPNMNERTENYREFNENNLLLPASDIYDAFDEKARSLYWKQASEGVYLHGIDGWWCDSSEPMTIEWSKKIKPPSAKMYCNYVNEVEKFIPKEKINAYGLVHAQTIYEGQRRETDKKRVVNLTRSTYVGGQRYGTILWSGDIAASWETLKKQIVAGLNFCASGFPYWTLDIGAFFVKKGEQWFWNGDYDSGLEDYGYKELFTRWYQLGAFLPIFRSHGTDVRREKWLLDKERDKFTDAILMANKLRYRILPYIYSYAFKIWKEDSTLMRMLAFDFMGDNRALEVTDQFMFGDSIMVCPVIQPMYFDKGSKKISNAVKTRKVYFPEGYRWYDFYTHEVFEGGSKKEVYADIDRIPLYIKEGSIIPMTDGIYSTQELDEAKIKFYIYSGKHAKYVYYQDTGDGYGYEMGEYLLDVYEWNETEHAFYKNGIEIDVDLYEVYK